MQDKVLFAPTNDVIQATEVTNNVIQAIEITPNVIQATEVTPNVIQAIEITPDALFKEVATSDLIKLLQDRAKKGDVDVLLTLPGLIDY